MEICTKKLKFNYDQKNDNSKIEPKSKLNLKNSINNNKFMQDFLNIKTLKIEDNDNKYNKNKWDKKEKNDSEKIECDSQKEVKTFKNIINNLQTPKILEKKILSNEEIKKSNSKSNDIDNKVSFKNELNYSGNDLNNYLLNYHKNFSPQQKNNESKLKTLENLKKNSKNWKSEKNIKIKKNTKNGFNILQLELNSGSNLNNGAVILANKKVMNKHITKLEPISFQSLYNAKIINKKANN